MDNVPTKNTTARSTRGTSPPVRSFHDLVVWQRGMDLAEEVYRTSAQMPPDERFGLTSQMRRAATSVPANIAEGHARESRKDYLRFLVIARGSLAELQTHILLAERLGLMSGQRLIALVREESVILQALIRSLRPPRPAAGNS